MSERSTRPTESPQLRLNQFTTGVKMQSSSSPPTRPAGLGSMPYPSLPASPTLTNPDMILPDYDDSAASPDRSQSPLIMWKNAQAADLQFNLSPQAFTAGPITPTTPIIYGNGTMLSDIGEVTEVESTCAPSRSRSGSTRSDFGIVTSTTLPYEAVKQKIKQSRAAHQRHTSVESNSTITTHDQTGLFADFDDAVSIDDSNFQGDDEDSVADSYIDDASIQESISPARASSNNMDEERYSTPLSRRAEQILANAKRRLTTMEGNLHRARSSLYSPSSMGSHSTPSPPIGRPATAIDLGNDHDYRKLSHGHTRIFSESNLPSENKPNVSTQRSSSALGTAGGYRRPLQSSRNPNHTHTGVRSTQSNRLYGTPSLSKSKISVHGQDRPLEPLSEDEVFEEGESLRLDTEIAQSDDFPTPTSGSFSDKGLKRSASSAQMRDLKDQVNDLKGRLSTLRDQARADSMKRRSLQSLRTPSPFTHARTDQWYADGNGHDDGTPPHDSSNTHMTHESNMDVHDGAGSSAESETPLEDHDEPQTARSVPTDRTSTPTMTNPANLVSASPTSVAAPYPSQEQDVFGAAVELDDVDDMRTENGYEYAQVDDLDGSASESGESSYHDSVQAQVSHEDREDAFDYEHFFLHSAMGSMSRRRMRRGGSNDSLSSEDSVETTRGPTASQTPGLAVVKTGRRSRRGSAGSTSTIDSFATATEGRHTRADVDAADEYLEQNITLPERARTHTPETAGRAVFSPEAGDSGSDPSRSRFSLPRRPQSSAAAFKHRPSVSSFESAGTNRSFQLVNKSKANGGVLTLDGSSDQELKRISETLMSETASICDLESMVDGEKATPMQMLQKDDQILVERLVASLGRCVLGLSEAGRASAESRAYRRKIETARRILEGLD
ncbi:hypothetical protein F5Y19DRAFT_432744 [Xylariaceae sp. FL1651]|nr:hypothetical protein F5Y19DRAFT_432744 [Xylariaceae sp. FL1651]